MKSTFRLQFVSLASLFFSLLVFQSLGALRNYDRFAGQTFSLVNLGDAISNDTNLYNACVNMPVDSGTNPTVQIRPFRNGVIIKASHFDYASDPDQRDMALVICDTINKPLYKNIDLLGSSDAQDGWVVQGSIPAWIVADPSYFFVTGISQPCFFRVVPYSGPVIALNSSYQPYDTVSNTITLQALITDLSGVTGDVFSINVDGKPTRLSMSAGNTVSINTKYNANGYCNLFFSGSSQARVHSTDKTAQLRSVFSAPAAWLPLDFENDTWLAASGDYSSPDIGTNYTMYGIDKHQKVAVKIWDPTNGKVMVNYTNEYDAGYVAVPWNFTTSDGITPYTNDTYVVTFTAFDPTLTITNRIAKFGVRTAAGCLLTYQWEDPAYDDGDYLNQQMDSWIRGSLQQLYTDVYKSFSLTQYTPYQISTNRNHGDCWPRTPYDPDWPVILSNLTNVLKFSDFTLGCGHGSGAAVGGATNSYTPGTFDPNDLMNRVQIPRNKNWRLRKAALWTCFSGDLSLSANGGGVYATWPEACGIPIDVDQTTTLCSKNCGFFLGAQIQQRGFSGSYGITTAQVATALDQTWMCGKAQYPGGCDPTYSFAFAINATRGRYNPQLDQANPRLFGCPFNIYTPNYDDELRNNNWLHVQTH
jgi:hypothetical protein